MSKLSFLIPLALLGCAAKDHARDVVGPFTGQVHRYAVDRIALPMTQNDTRVDGDDLDGDGVVDNALGGVSSAMGSFGYLSLSGPAMIGDGVIASSVEILADDLDNDPTVQVTYYGSANDSPIPVAGTLIDGVFRSNRSLTTAIPGRTTAVIPLFASADPSVLELDGLELDMTPDGAGGFDVVVRGGIPHANALTAAGLGLTQLIASNPSLHDELGDEFDLNHDGMLLEAEVEGSTLVTSLAGADVSLYNNGVYDPTVPSIPFDGDSVSAGFAIHLVPCAAGSCATPTADTCHDRVLDGDETDLDCGGSCDPCPGGARCAVAGDCQLDQCDAGSCRQPTCDDGIQDGFESDVDCGNGCAPCVQGKACFQPADCTTTMCNLGVC